MIFNSFFEALVTLRESTITSPSVGFTKLLTVLNKVDLPAPDIPTMMTKSPSSISKETLFNAFTPPGYVTLTFLNSIIIFKKKLGQ